MRGEEGGLGGQALRGVASLQGVRDIESGEEYWLEAGRGVVLVCVRARRVGRDTETRTQRREG